MTLDPELQRLIESARSADLPDEARLARVGEQLLSHVGPAGSDAATATKAAGGANTAATGVGLAIKVTGILSALGLAVWSVQQLPRRDAEVTRPVPAERSEAAAESHSNVTAPTAPAEVAGASAPLQPAAAGAPPDEAPRPTPRERRARGPTHERAAPDARENDFAGELSLMQRAVQAGRTGRTAEARALLAEHARRYPRGALRAERERLAAQLAAGTAPD